MHLFRLSGDVIPFRWERAVSVPLNAQDRTEIVTTGVDVTYPSTPHQHENTSTLLNHFLSITIRIVYCSNSQCDSLDLLFDFLLYTCITL